MVMIGRRSDSAVTLRLRWQWSFCALLWLVVAACSPDMNRGSPNETKLLELWRSAAATPQQRLDTVRELVSPGTDVAVIRKLLGPGELDRFHGAYIGYIGHSTNVGASSMPDEWVLRYKFPDTHVMLLLQPKTTSNGQVRLSFVRAELGLPATNRPATGGRP